MIRRDVQLPDGSAGWMLVSQIEHARISAQLAEHCLGRFNSPQLADVRREVLAAIEHHDDGWAEWERSPRLDAEQRPVSFMELATPEALEIWSRSIESAAEHGPLAARTVGGHFSRLIDKYSDSTRTDPQAAQWYAAMQRRGADWLDQWMSAQPAVRNESLADEALQWLWAFDEASLWFCCTCPVGCEDARDLRRQARVIGRGTSIEMEFSTLGAGVGDDRTRGVAFAAPWRFDVESINIEAAGRIVPARRYDSAGALFVASEPHTLRWQLRPATSDN